MNHTQAIRQQIQSNFYVTICGRYNYQLHSLLHDFERSMTFHCKGKVKGYIHMVPDVKAPDGELRYSSTLSLISALDRSGCLTHTLAAYDTVPFV